MRNIIQNEWRWFHPGHIALETDKYYSELANKVLKVLRNEGVRGAFYDNEELKDAALRLTAWFEDICSELGLWRVVNLTCNKRYGKPVPFYDTTNYVVGKLNYADVRLLL